MTEDEFIKALSSFEDTQNKDVEQQKFLFDVMDHNNIGEIDKNDF